MIDLLVWANLHLVEKIQEATIDFVARNFKIIFQSNEWENLMIHQILWLDAM